MNFHLKNYSKALTARFIEHQIEKTKILFEHQYKQYIIHTGSKTCDIVDTETGEITHQENFNILQELGPVTKEQRQATKALKLLAKLNEHTHFNFGKYKGISIEEVSKKDQKYIKWYIENATDTDSKFYNEVKKYISTNQENISSDVMSFGKYRGKTIEEIYKTDKQYIIWMFEKNVRPDLNEQISKLIKIDSVLGTD